MKIVNTYFPAVTDDAGNVSVRLTIHHAVYFVLLFLLVGAQPVSNFMMSGMEILLAVNWALEWDMRNKLRRAKESPLLWFFLLLTGVHLIWMIPSQNIAYGFDDLFRKLPMLAIPLVVLTSRPLNKKQIEMLFFCLVTTVFIAAIVGRVRLHTIPDIAYRDLPFISHIRFALNIVLSLVLIVAYLHRMFPRQPNQRQGAGTALGRWVMTALLVVVAISLLQFLLIIRSYTGFVILLVIAIVLLATYWRRISISLRRTGVAMVSVVILVFAVISGKMIHDYYAPVPLAQGPLKTYTASGNPYSHTEDNLIENGNYVGNYVCMEELQSEWAKRSSMLLSDTTVNGYAVMPTLVRYLNACGVTKDSVGMQTLTDEDVVAIENGIANPVYLHGGSLRKMYYVMLFEYESYRKLGAVKNFTMLQRFELWRNAWKVFCDHPLFGVGTGDVVDECHARLAADNSPLTGTKKHAHNQYLTFLVTFGLVGFIIIALAFCLSLRKSKVLRLPLFTAFLTIVLVSFLTEDTLETLAGCVFAVLFFCLLAVYREK